LFRSGEEDGKAYHFVTRENMEAAIGKINRFNIYK
jgi:guanylate kinase